MGVEMRNVAEFKFGKGGSIDTFQCSKCKSWYHNPLLENDYKKFDKDCEVRMTKNRIEIRCMKCSLTLILVTA
jgi:hypothetical protein